MVGGGDALGGSVYYFVRHLPAQARRQSHHHGLGAYEAPGAGQVLCHALGEDLEVGDDRHQAPERGGRQRAGALHSPVHDRRTSPVDFVRLDGGFDRHRDQGPHLRGRDNGLKAQFGVAFLRHGRAAHVSFGQGLTDLSEVGTHQAGHLLRHRLGRRRHEGKHANQLSELVADGPGRDVHGP